MGVALKAVAETESWITRCIREAAQTAPVPAIGLARIQRAGAEAFEKVGLPTSALEDWKYTNLAALEKTVFALPSNEQLEVPQGAFELSDQISIVFVNGKFRPSASSVLGSLPGVEIATVHDVFASPEQSGVGSEFVSTAHRALGSLVSLEQHPISAFNSALLSDGVVIRVLKDSKLKNPIHIQFVNVEESASTVTAPRVLIVAERGSEALVVESHSGFGSQESLSVSVTEVIVHENATLTHTKLQLESAQGNHLANTHVSLARDSRFHSNVLHFGGRLVRNEIHPVLEGTGIECYLNGLTVISRDQHVDNSTVLDHAQPNCFSRELYKGIYADHATGAFSGTIIVRQDAQKTNAIQSNQSVLLSDTASVQTRPQLKIWADDVKCTHGATVGQLDEDALFYLRSRGVTRADAQRMLLQAFAGEILKEVGNAQVVAKAEELLHSQVLGVNSSPILG